MSAAITSMAARNICGRGTGAAENRNAAATLSGYGMATVRWSALTMPSRRPAGVTWSRASSMPSL